MEIRRYENVTVTYIPKSGNLQIWSKDNEQLGLFTVLDED